MRQFWYTLMQAMDDLEPRYRAHYLAADARQTIVAIAVWLFPATLLAGADYLNFGWSSLFAVLAASRLAFCAFSLYTIAALRKVSTPREYDILFLRWAAFSIAVVLLVNYIWARFVPPNGAVTVLILFSAYMVFPNRLSVRVIPPLALSAGNLLLQLGLEPIDPNSLLSMIVALIMANVLGIIFSTWLQNHRLTEFRARLEEARIREELSRLASTDELTGILNRRKLMQLAGEEYETARRDSRPLSVMLIDIDHFKRLNDNCGHETGDLILADFTAYVTGAVTRRNIWGRLGGDEFVLVLPALPCDQANCIAEQLRRGFAGDSFPRRKATPDYTISIGITEVRAKDQSIDGVLKRADKALYRAKRNGRNRTEIL